MMLRLCHVLAALALTASTVVFAQAPAGGPPQGQRPPQPPPSNLKVLPKDMTRQQVIVIMHAWEGELGVECEYCHAKDTTTGRLKLRLRRQPHQGPCPRHDEDDQGYRRGLPDPVGRPQTRRLRRRLRHLPPRHGKAPSIHPRNPRAPRPSHGPTAIRPLTFS